MKIKIFYRIAIVGLSFLLMYSCNDIKQSFKDTFKSEQDDKDQAVEADHNNSVLSKIPEETAKVLEEIPEPVPFLSDSMSLNNAQEVLMSLPKFKGKRLMFSSDIHFYADGRINIDLQDPDKPENLDEYRFEDGHWKDPKPVHTSGRNNINKQIIPLEDIRFSAVASIFKQINKRAEKIEGAQPVSHIYFVYIPHFGKKIWYASVTGTRESYGVTANIDGEIIDFERN